MQDLRTSATCVPIEQLGTTVLLLIHLTIALYIVHHFLFSSTNKCRFTMQKERMIDLSSKIGLTLLTLLSFVRG